MSSVAAPTRLGGVRARTASVPADAAAVAGLACLTIAMVALTWGTWGDLGRDTGYDFVAAQRVAAGELPYIDYVYYYGPLSPLLGGFAAWLGGGGIEPMIGLGLVLALLVIAATYALGRMLAGPRGGFLAAAITVPVAVGPSNFSLVLPHSFSATLGVLLALCFLLGVARYAATGGLVWLLGSGTAVGLVGLTRPEFELAVLLAAGVWLGLRWHAGLGGWRETALFAVPAIAIPALVYGAFLLGVPARELVLENLYPRETLAEGGSAVLRNHAPLTAGSLIDLVGKLVLYAVGTAALVFMGISIDRARGRARTALIGVCVLLGLMAVAVSLVRPETMRYWLQYAYGWIPAGIAIALVVLLVRYRRSGQGWNTTAQLAVAAAVVLTVLAAKAYAVFFLHQPEAQPAVYAVPLAAVFLARLQLVELARTPTVAVLGAAWLAFLALAGVGLTLKDSAAESASVSGSGGSLAAVPGDVPLQRALDIIEARTSPGERILLAPQLTGLYTLSGREDPLPQISLLPGALPTEQDERAAIAALDRAGVRLAVTDRRPFTEYGQTSFGGSFDRLLAGWIRSNFAHVATLAPGPGGTHTLDVWIRRGVS